MKSWKRIALSILMLVAVIMLQVVPVTAEAAVKINKTKLTLNVGKTATLMISGTKSKVTWTSSKKAVATVTSKGKVTAVAEGAATITAKVGDKKYTCKVTVKELDKDEKVTVTVANYFTSNGDSKKFIDDLKIEKIVENDDLTTTYTMTKSQQKKILDYIKSQLSSIIKSELPEYYKSITYNDEMTEFSATVDRSKYEENSTGDMTALGFLMFSGIYQSAAGVSDKDSYFKIDYMDANTKKIFYTFDSRGLE